jgi:hypothetical protein
MCRRIKLDYEKDTEHLGLASLRYIPSIKQFASPEDEDETVRNPENQCYCVEGFSCLKVVMDQQIKTANKSLPVVRRV